MRWTRTGIAVAKDCVCGGRRAVGLAGKPTIAREAIDETSPDVFLTTECGVPVMSRASGHQITRTHRRDGSARRGVHHQRRLTATSENGTFRFNDVGADMTRITKDGVVHQITRQAAVLLQRNGVGGSDDRRSAEGAHEARRSRASLGGLALHSTRSDDLTDHAARIGFARHGRADARRHRRPRRARDAALRVPAARPRARADRGPCRTIIPPASTARRRWSFSTASGTRLPSQRAATASR